MNESREISLIDFFDKLINYRYFRIPNSGLGAKVPILNTYFEKNNL